MQLETDFVECEFKELTKKSTNSKGEEGGSGVEIVEYHLPNIEKDMDELLNLVANKNLEELARKLISDFEIKAKR